MIVLENRFEKMVFDDEGRVTELTGGDGATRIPLDAENLTEAFCITLRNSEGRTIRVVPRQKPLVETSPDAVCFTWRLTGNWGELCVCGKVQLSEHSRNSLWKIEIENHTPHAIWEVAYPRISGLTSFGGKTPDWLIAPCQFGEKVPDPVTHVGNLMKNIEADTGREPSRFEEKPGIAYCYPGKWTMQFVAYGHPDSGGIYFAAHDGQALYKKFGLYADGNDGRHAVLVMKQYPEDRTAAGANFASFYATAIGVYEGEWWGASAIYREWAINQQWCAKGPVRRRKDIPQWVKELDVWYWNWQFAFYHLNHPKSMIPFIKHVKENIGCNIAFHWYGCNSENQITSPWRGPDIYPHNPSVQRVLKQSVRELHDAGIHCIPYVNPRLWNEDDDDFRDIDGMKWICVNENGESGDPWIVRNHTMCPTAKPTYDIISRIANRMIEEFDMDGIYMDQVTSCYATPCFNPHHDHAPGGHDHWRRGYHEMFSKVRESMRRNRSDAILTSESVIECFMDLFDADLARGISRIHGIVVGGVSEPIALFHSVYHDYHMTYGTAEVVTDTIDEDTGSLKANINRFRYAEALCLTGGGQLMLSGFFAGSENNEKHRPFLEYMEKLIRARITVRKWLNLGEWKPPVPVECNLIDLDWSPRHPPKRNIPTIICGCFLLDDELCIVLVNHTTTVQEATIRIDLNQYHFAGETFLLSALHPEKKKLADINLRETHKQPLIMAPESVHILIAGIA